MRNLFKFSLHNRKLNTETISDFQGFKNSKKNSFRKNYSRKYSNNKFLTLSITPPENSKKFESVQSFTGFLTCASY